MKGFLLDVNVLIALLWTRHEHHAYAQRWFAGVAPNGWATCALTQVAFVRILSNPAFSPEAVRPGQATAVLAANLKHASHRLWPDRWGFASVVEPFGDAVLKHQQVTDAYLLGLALKSDGRLATFDRGIGSLLAGHTDLAGLIEHVPVARPPR